jgi:hypothetical protein
MALRLLLHFFVLLLDFLFPFSYFCIENPKGGRVSPPFAQIEISSFILIFQIFNEIAAFIFLLGFRFSYSFQGFRIILCNLSLITLQSYGIYAPKNLVLTRTKTTLHSLTE